MQEYRSILWLVAMGFFMQQLDSTIINTALPNIAKSLHENPLNMQSVIVAYVLAMAVTIPASGWIADKYGLRKTYFFAIVLFSVASIGCALSQNLTQLIIARVFQGIGGALLQPVGRLTLLKVMPKTQLLAALSFVSIPGLIGPLIGPSLGGLLVEYTSWHWIFLMNVPIGMIGAFFTLKILPDLKLEQLKPFDFTGFTFVAISMVSLLFVLDNLVDQTHSQAIMLFIFILGLSSGVAYWLHSSRVEDPLFSPHIFKVNSFSVGLLGNLFARLGNAAIPFIIPLMLQVALGFNPTVAGLMIIPLALGAMLIKRFISRLIHAFGYKKVLVVNTLLVGLGIASFALISTHTPMWWQAIHFFLFGLVNSIQFTAMNTVTIKDLDVVDAGSGNSLLSVTQQLAMSMGVAMASAVLNNFTHQYQIMTAFHYTFLCLGALTICSSLIFAQLRKKATL
ncbi:multidrug transporter subunit MdtD [Acinetobacter sp. HY1485]|uniref:multidrug transporter subunit MdtD n=1 Tax=Acinetobacter sp. HY1485 TaxID=2970918 RepID=UPI0022B945DD|nr:multidrug transporter subunit MdtD [Acinetobacter sp. HY1485]